MNTAAASIIPDDRRDALRQPSVLVEIIVEEDSGAVFSATIQDVSRTGIRFRSMHKFDMNTFVILHPPANIGLDACQVEIVRGYEVEENGHLYYDFGARYTELSGRIRHAWFLSLRKSV